MQKLFIGTVLAVVFVLILFLVYNKDTKLIRICSLQKHKALKIGIRAQYKTDLWVFTHIGSSLPCPTTCPEELKIEERSQDASYVIPSDVVLAKLNYTDLLTIFHRSMNDFSFEAHAIRLYGCEVHTFDPFATGYNSPKGCTYHRIGLGPKNGIKYEKKFQTLGSIINYLKHRRRIIDILKIDIEGAEWRALEEVLEGNILQRQVKQIQIEMHFPYKKHEVSFSRFVLGLLRRLNEIGFLMFSRERNVFCRICTFTVPELNLEFTFASEFCLLNKKFFTVPF